jgi:hypothetical protein
MNGKEMNKWKEVSVIAKIPNRGGTFETHFRLMDTGENYVLLINKALPEKGLYFKNGAIVPVDELDSLIEIFTNLNSALQGEK